LRDAMPDASVVDREVARLRHDPVLVRVRGRVEIVALPREERPDALLVRERDEPDAALLDRGVVEVDADVEIAARLLEVEHVAETIRWMNPVPSARWPARSGTPKTFVRPSRTNIRSISSTSATISASSRPPRKPSKRTKP